MIIAKVFFYYISAFAITLRLGAIIPSSVATTGTIDS